TPVGPAEIGSALVRYLVLGRAPLRLRPVSTGLSRRRTSRRTSTRSRIRLEPKTQPGLFDREQVGAELAAPAVVPRDPARDRCVPLDGRMDPHRGGAAGA